jgi:hypothetical protein
MTLIFPANYDAYQAGVSSPGQTGAAHAVSGDGLADDVVDRLRAVVEEVTGEPIARPANKIGFY